LGTSITAIANTYQNNGRQYSLRKLGLNIAVSHR
jgi:hypothetical protein